MRRLINKGKQVARKACNKVVDLAVDAFDFAKRNVNALIFGGAGTGIAVASSPAMAEPDPFVMPDTEINLSSAIDQVGAAVSTPMGKAIGWGFAFFAIVLIAAVIRRQFRKGTAG